MLTLDHLRRALKRATACDSPGSPDLLSAQSLHQRRAGEWVRCLAHELTTLVKDEGDVRVLFRNNPDEANRADFGLNELLYDVCICRTAEHPSARGGRTLRYVTEALWLVESEFARDSVQAVKDFNKLVIGQAKNKLFIGPRISHADETGYLDALLPVARASAANGASSVYAALVPHPGEWATPDVADVVLHRYARPGWETL
ncbi:MAG TPA: hypothetical protein VGR35_03775 [Tepidisphaeraceae bacterium]|nr:hypothetical protein [Tepidisphaeraceae bacterium]